MIPRAAAGEDGAAEFTYHARFHAHSRMPGAHASRILGSGMEFAARVPLWQARDPRRLDLHASLRDPFGGWWVREFHQRSGIRVILLADVSASMQGGWDGQAAPRRALVAGFAQALRHSAVRCGDAFGLHAFAGEWVAALHLPPTRARQAALAAVQRLGLHDFAGTDVHALARAAEVLPREPALVFLMSDFHFEPARLDAALGSMARHDVVPVWLDEPDALSQLRHAGLMELRDPETGRLRTVWMRRALRTRWIERAAAHRAAVEACLARHHRTALRLAAPLNVDAVSEYFALRGRPA